MEMNFATVWEQAARALPDSTALVHGERGFTWAQFDDRASRLAALLAAEGLGPDSKFGIYLYNCNEYVEAQYAGFKTRACPVNVNYRYLEDELVYLLDNADAEAVVFHASFAERIDAIRDRLPKLRLLIQVDDGSERLIPGALDFEEIIAGHEPMAPIERSSDDLYMIYTGGTTGMPKGVMYRNGGMCEAMMGGYPLRGLAMPERPEEIGPLVTQLNEAGANPITVVACPLMHGTGMWLGAMIPLNMGGCVVTLPSRKFDPDELWRAVERERATDLVIVGDAFAKPMVQALDAAKAAGKPYDISSVARVISSGVMWTAEVKARMLEYGEMMLLDAMGSSEGGMGMSVTARENINETAKFALNDTARVFTDDDREVQPGSGEIGKIGTSANVPLGYYKDPEKSAATFRTIDGVHYSFPGDYATVEADGTIVLLGRGSNCINSAGEKIFPEEVEEAIKRHPDVFDCLVVGVADEKFGQRVVAVVECVAPEHVSDEELVTATRAHLSSYKLPKQVVFVDKVERAVNGKADYKWAQQIAEAATG